MVIEIIKGLATTFKHIFQPRLTVQYPEEKREVRPRFKGRHVLKRYDNGLEKCIGCSLCAAACPADAIFVEASENTDKVRYSPGERYASVYEINMLRCIFCGYCEDACPTEAIVLEHEYALSYLDRESAIYVKDKLLVTTELEDLITPMEVEPGAFDRAIPDMENPD
ncbi:MAG TPA: NADH-quinone oxidoreductase subunit NuoI [Chloroflexi bacterium]|nr:NADH-quinone oxidoreductase subunit NuoI [Chloroflexota bacterium]HCU97829.1 NADH-quinone oxidoreductase subunit NuoI [Chloroflexota bacterium]|tara:strand:+ start:405 stop:905 length:501 start_codon:yes stop_codon:yes gene_type:complete